MTSLRTFSSDRLTDEEAETLRALFAAAWPDEPFSADDWQNCLGGTHVVLEGEAGTILSHAAVVERELHVGDRRFRTGYVEAMATWPEQQNRGHGTQVLQVVNELIRDGYELGGLDTGSPWFYERFGWRRWLGPTSVRRDDRVIQTPEEDGNVMVLLTPLSDELDLSGQISCEWRPGEAW